MWAYSRSTSLLPYERSETIVPTERARLSLLAYLLIPGRAVSVLTPNGNTVAVLLLELGPGVPNYVLPLNPILENPIPAALRTKLWHRLGMLALLRLRIGIPEAPLVTDPMALLEDVPTRDALAPLLLPVLQLSSQVRWKSRLLTTSLACVLDLLWLMFPHVTTACARFVGTMIAFLQDL